MLPNTTEYVRASSVVRSRVGSFLLAAWVTAAGCSDDSSDGDMDASMVSTDGDVADGDVADGGVADAGSDGDVADGDVTDAGSDGDVTDAGCPDEDNDMICDADDLCPGSDDAVDDDSDGVPDGCDPCLDFFNPGGSPDTCLDSLVFVIDPGEAANTCESGVLTWQDTEHGFTGTLLGYSITGINATVNDPDNAMGVPTFGTSDCENTSGWVSGPPASLNMGLGFVRSDNGMVNRGRGLKVDFPYDASFNTETFTIEAWAKLRGGNNYADTERAEESVFRNVLAAREIGTVGSLGEGYFIAITNIDQWEFRYSNGTVNNWARQIGPQAVLDEWTLLTATLDDAGEQRFYVNGVSYDPITNPDYIPNSGSVLRVGSGATNDNFPGLDMFFGEIGRVTIYNEAQAESVIVARYLAERPRYNSNRIVFVNGTASYSSGSGSVALAADGQGQVVPVASGWSTEGGAGEQTAVWEFLGDTSDFSETFGDAVPLQVALHFENSVPELRSFRISVTTADRAEFADGQDSSGDLGDDAIWTTLTPVSVRSNLPSVLLVQSASDPSVVIAGNSTVGSVDYFVNFETDLVGITGLRLEAVVDPEFPDFGPGYGADGEFTLSEISATIGMP